MVLPETFPVNFRPAGSVTVVPDSRVTSGSSKTTTTAAGAALSRAPGAGEADTGTACAEAAAGSSSCHAAPAITTPASRSSQARTRGPLLGFWPERITVNATRPTWSPEHEGQDSQQHQRQQDRGEHCRVILR